MQFKKVNSKKMRLGDEANVSKTYTRQVVEGSRLTQFIEKTSEKKEEVFDEITATDSTLCKKGCV